MSEISNTSIQKIGLIVGPVAAILLWNFVPETFISPITHKALSVAALMIVWWVTEAAPLAVTSLLPIILFPAMGVMKIAEAATPYANPIIFLFLGGFIIALALEKHRLHERISLHLIKLTGTSGNGIIFGFMIATGFISMWISNTATTMMMLPMAISVVNLVSQKHHGDVHDFNKKERNFATGLMLTIGYAASLGGLATIIGTPPNVVFIGLLQKYYGTQIDFSVWMIMAAPIAIILLLSMHFLITRVLLPNHLKKIEGTDELIKSRMTELGKMRKEEKLVLTIFLTTSLCWIFQQPINMILKGEYLTDTNVALAGGIAMFIVPVEIRELKFLLNWNDTHKLAWGILLLFGGGLCLADSLQKAGVIQAIGHYISTQGSYTGWLLLILIVATVLLSELMSNVALVQVFIPVIFGIANGLHINPILLGLPVTLAASIGFMLPMATPPNAIVFASGHVKLKDMVRTGIVLDIVSIVIIYIASETLITWFYN